MEYDPLIRAANRILVERERQEEKSGALSAKIKHDRLKYSIAFTLIFFLVFSISLIMTGLVTYSSPSAVIAVLATLFILLLVCVALGGQFEEAEFALRAGRMGLMFLIVGTFLGTWIYFRYELIYQSYTNMRVWTNVQGGSDALHFLDASALYFSSSTNIQTEFSVGYKSFGSGNTEYCVAPIRDASQPANAVVNFYAVGENCCGQRGAFFCDDAQDPGAKSGLVILDGKNLVPDALSWLVATEGQRKYYEKAVQMQNAYYKDFHASDMIFVRWSKNPDTLAKKFREETRKYLGIALGIFLVLTMAAGMYNGDHLTKSNIARQHGMGMQ